MQKFSPKQYLKIDIANSFGHDKLRWEERIEWFDQNEHQLHDLVPQAEKPAMFYAGIRAWEKAKEGKPTGYPISLDATSSGLQILAVLTGDRSAAELSNVLPNNQGNRNNAYMLLFQALESKLEEHEKQSNITYEKIKKVIMTAFYGSQAEPRKLLGEGKTLAKFYQTLEEEAPLVWELNEAFLNMWDPTALKYSWVLPDNFHVHCKVTDLVHEDVEFMGHTVKTSRKENIPVKKGRSLGANVTHSVDGFIVREMVHRCGMSQEQKDYVQELILLTMDVPPRRNKSNPENIRMVLQLWDHYQKSGYLSSRILDYLDEESIFLVNTDPIQDMLDSLPEKPFRIIPTHDCFRVHPNYGNDLRKQYNLQLSLIAQSDMLSFLLSQLLGRHIQINKIDDLAEEILQAEYALS